MLEPQKKRSKDGNFKNQINFLFVNSNIYKCVSLKIASVVFMLSVFKTYCQDDSEYFRVPNE